MKRLAGFSLAVFIALFACMPAYAETPGPFDLLPNDHWSYDALAELASTPLLDSKDVQFDRNVEITRFEVALLVAKILDTIGKMQAGGISPVPFSSSGLDGVFQRADLLASEGYLTSEQLRLIRKLAVNFGEELADLGVQIRDIELQDSVPRNDTSISLERFLSGQRSTVVDADSTVHSTDSLTIGTKVVKRLQEGESSKSMAAVEGSMRLGNAIRLRGEYAGNPGSDSLSSEAITIGATIDVGSNVIVGVDYRTIQAGFDPVYEEEDINTDRQAYNLYLKVGDLLLNTERLQISPLTESQRFETSWELVYDLPGRATVKAGYTVIDLASLQEANDQERVAKLGLDLPVHKDSLIRIGLNYDLGVGTQRFIPQSASAGVTYTLPGAESAVLKADLSLEDEGEAKRTTTSFTFDYSLQPDASLTLGYRLIDFTDVEGSESQNANVATAEFRLRF